MNKRSLQKHAMYDVVIVPGIPFNEPAWDKVMQLRLLWAKYLFDKGYTKNIITSGTSAYSPYVEADVMAAYLVAMGVPKENIYTEKRAEHSTENLWYGYLLAKKLNFKTIALCSDPFQSKMLYRFAKKKTKKQVQFLPAIFDTIRTLPQDTPFINYEVLKLDSPFVPITEKYSKWQRFKGTMGRNIDYSNTKY